MSNIESLDINPGGWVEVCSLDNPKMVSNRSALYDVVWQVSNTPPAQDDISGMFLASEASVDISATGNGNTLYARVQGLGGAMLSYWEHAAPEGDADRVMALVIAAVDTWRDQPLALDVAYPTLDLGAYKATVVWITNGSFVSGVETGIDRDDVVGISGTGYYPAGTDAVPNSRVILRMSGSRVHVVQESGYNLSRGVVLVIYHK